MNLMTLMTPLSAITVVLLLAMQPTQAQQQPTPPKAFRLTEKSVGPIDGTTPFDKNVLAQAFPGYGITAGIDGSEGEVVGRNFSLSWQGQKVFVVHAAGEETSIFSVEVLHRQVTGPHNTHINASFALLCAKGELECEAGLEEASGEFFCRLPQLANIIYVGSGTAEGGPDGTLPSKKAICAKKIKRFFWKPPKRS